MITDVTPINVADILNKKNNIQERERLEFVSSIQLTSVPC